MLKIEDQVCSLELAKKLKSLNVEQESLNMWVRINIAGEDSWSVTCDSCQLMANVCPDEKISAPTVAELGEIMGAWMRGSYCTHNANIEHEWICKAGDSREYTDVDKGKALRFFKAKTEADARAKALIYLIENGHYETRSSV
jgi:hypothetical protein